ncbi:hypothetical protein P3T40_004515 [Paraburkholderia sp. EB58]|jgi:hypothetical protein|uniref:hypothetical protein n=1 Tax=Paraburkholderia sp. EB58 TaxID=3035125 RepID=UPI003D1B88A2
MSESNINNDEAAVELYAQAAAGIFSYVVDCKFDESHLNASNLFLAIEYAYRRHPRFWRDLKIETVADGVSRRFPSWRQILDQSGKRPNTVLKELEETIFMNAFDEANAEMLLALPESERPTNADAAFLLISKILSQKGLQKQVEYAERDGYRCGEEALNGLYRLTQGQRGITVERLGTGVARMYRDAVVNRAY